MVPRFYKTATHLHGIGVAIKQEVEGAQPIAQRRVGRHQLADDFGGGLLGKH